MDLPVPVVCLGHRRHMCLSPLSFQGPGALKPSSMSQCGDPASLGNGWGWAGIVTATLGFVLGFALACMAVLCKSKEEEEEEEIPFMGGRKRNHS